MLELMSRSGFKATKLAGTQVRKQILRFGTFQHPNPIFWGDEDGDWVIDEEYVQKIIKNFEAGVIDSVKLIDGTHFEDGAKLLGSIVKLEMVDDGLDAIFDIEDEEFLKHTLEPMADGQPLRDGVSVGIDEKYPRSEVTAGQSRWVKGPVLRHVASVTIPFINGMRSWKRVEQFTASQGRKEKGYFGHVSYTGQPLVPSGEVYADMDLDQLIAVLAKDSDKSEDEIRASLETAGIIKAKKKASKEKKKKTKRSNVENDVVSVLERIQSFLDDDDDDDDDDDSRGSTKVASRKKVEKKKASKKMSKRTDDDDDDDDDDVEAVVRAQLKPFATSIKELADSLSAGMKSVEEQKKEALDAKAQGAVDTLIDAGKVLPVEADHWKKLYLKDVELFEATTENLPVKVSFDQRAASTGTSREVTPSHGKMTTEQVEEESKRYLSKYAEDRPSSRGDRVSDMAKKEA